MTVIQSDNSVSARLNENSFQFETGNSALQSKAEFSPGDSFLRHENRKNFNTYHFSFGAGLNWKCKRVPAAHMNTLPLVRQSTNYTCGAAALQSILYYYGDEWREDNLANELHSNPDQGTNYLDIIRVATARGLAVDTYENMTIEDIKGHVAKGLPVMVALQAWSDDPKNYANGWEDGHYAVVTGYDKKNLYFMDPSTLGQYAYIPIEEFEARWHDYYLDPQTSQRVNLTRFGMVFRSNNKPSFNPEQILPMG